MTDIEAGDMVCLSERAIKYWLGEKHVIDRGEATQQKSFIKGGIAIVTKITRDQTHVDRIGFDVAHIIRPDGEKDQWATNDLEKI